MGELQHTPGPWHVAGAHGYGDLAGHAIRSNSGYVIAVTVTDVEPLEQDSLFNAHAMAAAPDLLEACKALLLQALQSDLNDPANEWGQDAILAARAAIAKATTPNTRMEAGEGVGSRG